MAQIAVQPHVLKDIRFKVDADNYEKHLSQAELVPTVNIPQVTWQGLTPDAKFVDTGNPDIQWALTTAYAQDWDTPNSYAQYLLDHAGEQKTIVLQPKAGTGEKTFTVTATIVPGPIGGTVNTTAVGTVTMPVSGEPAEGTAV